MPPTRQRILLLHVNGQVIRTTADHPFYVAGQGWTAASNLHVGDRLRSNATTYSTGTANEMTSDGTWNYYYRGLAATKGGIENGVYLGEDRWFLGAPIDTREQTPWLPLQPLTPSFASIRTRFSECWPASIA